MAEFSVVTPEQPKHITPVDKTILCMMPQADSDPTACLNDFLMTNKREQQGNTFWFPTPENPGKIENHNAIQTRILKKLYEMKEKEKLNPKNDTKSPKQIF